MCLYYGPAALHAQLAQSKASDTFKRAQSPGSKTDGTEVATAADQLIDNLGLQKGEGDGEQPLLMLGLDADGRAQMAAVSASKAIFSSRGRNAADPGQKGLSFGSEIPALDDKAIRLLKLGLNVLQGGVLIRSSSHFFKKSTERLIGKGCLHGLCAHVCETIIGKSWFPCLNLI